jgi:hypothetical protein
VNRGGVTKERSGVKELLTTGSRTESQVDFPGLFCQGIEVRLPELQQSGVPSSAKLSLSDKLVTYKRKEGRTLART